ncbi:MAG: thioredoxin [Muribaculaceae bacterium]|nr:thioredoxin [Muribaculaceae bacterium]
MNDFNEIIKSSKPTLVDFYASWCGPCKMQSPIIEQLKVKIGDEAKILKVDVDKNQALAMQYRVMSIPTLMIFKGGEIVWRESGLQQLDFLEAKIKQYV